MEPQNKKRRKSFSLEDATKSLTTKTQSSVLDTIERGQNAPPLDSHKLSEEKKNEASKWFDLPLGKLTPELKMDLQLLQMRNYIDPKHHYKRSKSKELPKYFQVGRVVESAADFYSSRLTNKERKSTFVDELLDDQALKKYSKRKFLEIQKAKTSGGKKFYSKLKSKRRKSFS